ncbi:MAG: methyltransferase [Acidobacteria bacterium]|nr:methyltransferase [Acidobacteriota bacterium]
MNDSSHPHPLPPEAQMLQIATGFFPAQAIFVVTKLRIPELLADGPKTSADLATATDTDERSLYRVLRAIASIGVFEELPDRSFANTPVSETLCADHPNSARDMVLWMLEEPHWRVYGELLYSVQTGKTAWDKVYGEPVFASLFGSQKELGTVFNKAMASFSRQTIPAILAAYDFSGANTIADIAGGYGHLLGAVLKEYSDKRGVLFEVAPVLEGAPAMLDTYGVRDRVELVEGDFTEAIPVKADIYMLKHIIHDWYDDKCQTILSNIRNEMPGGAKVLIIDAIIPPPGEPHFSKFLDLEMLMLPGGMERTAAEFESLLDASGFKMTQIIPTPSPISIVEAVKA